MQKTLMRAIPYIEARFQGRKQRPKSISLSLSDTTSDSGAALGIANYWHSPSSPLESSHYVVDEEHIFQCVPDNVVAVTSPERGVVRINVCARPTTSTEDFPVFLLQNAASLTARLCWTHGIPAVYVGLEEHRRRFRRGGIMCSVQGAWPKQYFLDMVNQRLATYKEEGGL